MNWLLRLLGFGSDGTTLKFGKTTVFIDFDTPSGAVVRLGDYSIAVDIDAEELADAARTVVAHAADAAQDLIDRRRAVEDAGRLLGQ